jgi:hypothetical protein
MKKMEYFEFEVGESVKVNGKLLTVVERPVNDCTGCAFNRGVGTLCPFGSYNPSGIGGKVFLCRQDMRQSDDSIRFEEQMDLSVTDVHFSDWSWPSYQMQVKG